MARHLHSSATRLHDSLVFLLVADLLRLGARTKTVERLTGVGEGPIRDVYREIYKTSPTKGPTGYSHTWYISTPIIQFSSSIAAACIHTYVTANSRHADEDDCPPDNWLGRLYVEAFKTYKGVAERVDNLHEGMSFERFAYLGAVLSKSTVLGFRACTRCKTPYLGSCGPQHYEPSVCPACTISERRTCPKCDTYVKLDHGSLPPTRSAMCIDCAVKLGRKTTKLAYARSLGLNPDDLNTQVPSPYSEQLVAT